MRYLGNILVLIAVAMGAPVSIAEHNWILLTWQLCCGVWAAIAWVWQARAGE